jgi:hypothetical protein
MAVPVKRLLTKWGPEHADSRAAALEPLSNWTLESRRA